MKVAIIGHGFVGNATEHFITTRVPMVDEVVIEDPAKNLVVEDWSDVNYTFICVPTDLVDGKLSINILLQALRKATGTVVIRSTVGVEHVSVIKSATNNNVVFWPEFLREKSWKQDAERAGESEQYPIILGGDANLFHHDILDGLEVVRMSAHEAVIAKMSRNAMLAAKVAQANMLFDLCKKYKSDYSIVKNFIGRDGVLGSGHMDVPGHDGSRGFHGKCLPKDTTHYESLFDYDNLYTSLLEYNETL